MGRNESYSMDLMLNEINRNLEKYKNGKEHLKDYEVNQTLTDFQRGYKYCLENQQKYIKEIGMWQERMLRH